MILTEYRYDPKAKDSKSVYLVRHNSRIHQTVLEQHLTIERDSFGRFIPTIELKDFPEGLSDRESMLKLADWLTKSTITRERAEQLANFKGAPVTRQEEQELARMALAAMDSEPVAWMSKGGTVLNGMRQSAHDFAHYNIPLYRHAQPAPAVPDEMTPEMMRAVQLNSELGEYAASNLSGAYGLFAEFWRVACRAAMLQAEPVTTANKLPETQFKQVADLYEMQFDDGRTCAFHTDAEKAVQWLNACDGNKVQEYVKLERLHDAVSVNSPVIPDTWIPVSERMPENKPGSYEYLVFEKLNNRVNHDYWNVPDAGDDTFTPFWNHYGEYVTHWMPLPAAPQEVK